MIGKLSFDDRDTAFDLGASPVKGFWKVSPEVTEHRVLLPTGRSSIADRNRIPGFQTTADVTMVRQRVETLVHGQGSDTNPPRFLFGNGTQFPGIARRSPTGMLSENKQGFVLDKKNMFDEPPMPDFPSSFQAVALIPEAPQVMRSRVGQAIPRAVAQGVAPAFQGLLQILQKIGKQFFDRLSSEAPVKLLKCRVIGALQEAQKLLEPGICQNLFFGLPVCPFVVPSQKHQSQKLTLPIGSLGELVRVILNGFLAKLKAYQDKLFVACQLFHESSSFSQRSLSGGAFVYSGLQIKGFQQNLHF